MVRLLSYSPGQNERYLLTSLCSLLECVHRRQYDVQPGIPHLTRSHLSVLLSVGSQEVSREQLFSLEVKAKYSQCYKTLSAEYTGQPIANILIVVDRPVLLLTRLTSPLPRDRSSPE